MDAHLAEYLTSQARLAVDDKLPKIITEVLSPFFAAGDKRLRPLLVVIGGRAFGGEPLPGLIRLGAAGEMFHVFCLGLPHRVR